MARQVIQYGVRDPVAHHLSLQGVRRDTFMIQMMEDKRRDLSPTFSQGHFSGIHGSGVSIQLSTDSTAEQFGQVGMLIPLRGSRHIQAFLGPQR